MTAYKPFRLRGAAIAFLGLPFLASCAEHRPMVIGSLEETYIRANVRQIADHLREDVRLHPQVLMHAPSGEALIRFHIQASGTIDQVEVVKSSGSADVDQYLADVVAHSGPFKPPRDYGVLNPRTLWVTPFELRSSSIVTVGSP